MKFKIRKQIAIILIGTLFCSTIGWAQKTGIEIQVSANFPFIPDVTNQRVEQPIPPSTGYWSSIYGPAFQESYNENTGGKLNFNIYFELSEKIYIKTGIGFDLLRFQRNVEALPSDRIIEINLPDSIAGLPAIPIGSITSNKQDQNLSNLGKTAILYTEVPIMAGYKFLNEKFLVEFGITTSIITYSEQYRYTSSNSQSIGNNAYAITKDKSSDGLNNVTFSVNAGISYYFAKRFYLFGKYSKSLNPIYDEEYQLGGKAKYHLFELGIGFKIL